MRYFCFSFTLVGCLFFSHSALAVISGPTSSTGSFTITWDGLAARLKEQGSDQVYYGGTAAISRPTGTYIYEEQICFGFPGYPPLCGVVDTHTVSVSANGGGNPPLSSLEQSNLEFQLHVGDFDGDGYSDIYVNRLTPGAVDGSMQDSILYRNSSGGFTAGVPTAAQASAAASHPVSTLLRPCLGELNFDGHQDLIIEGMDAQFGSSFDPEMMVFAPATIGTSMPLGIKSVDQSVLSFQNDQSQSAINSNFFIDQIGLTLRPVFSSVVSCISDFDQVFATPSFCSIAVVPVGVIAVPTGTPTFNPNSPLFSAFNRAIGINENFSGDSQWWLMAQRFHAVYGVYAFGFAADGSRTPTNFANEPVTDTQEDEFRKIYLDLQTAIYGRWVNGPVPTEAVPPEDWPEHSYQTNNPICQIGVGNCTVAQLFCWMRRVPAPRLGGEIDFPEGEEIKLNGGNPIITHEFPGQSTIVNETQQGHILHDPLQDQGCGADPDVNSIPDRCAVVVRKIVSQGGFLRIETQGRGNNANFLLVELNERAGEVIFNGLDGTLNALIRNGRDCFTVLD